MKLSTHESRDKKFCEGIDLLRSIDMEFTRLKLDGTIKISKKTIMSLPEMDKEVIKKWIGMYWNDRISFHKETERIELSLKKPK
jgi:hypothetical protein